MNRISTAFQREKAFIGFLTAGDPSLSATEELILQMERAGAGLIEIGIPFSDPVAEGKVIQNANVRALKQGAFLPQIFELVARVRAVSQIPLVFLSYLNPVMQYGYEAFFAKCGETGVDGIIFPELPFEEKGEVSEIARRYGVSVISLIAPTSRERIRAIAAEAEGFLYVVSSMGVTGTRSEITTDLPAMIREIRAVTDVPVAVGFGIHTPEQAKKIAALCDGVIVGSGIVKMIEEHGEQAAKPVYDYVKRMKEAMLSEKE